MRRTTLVVVLVVALVSAPVAGATVGPADAGTADVGDAPPSATNDQCTFPVTRTDATGERVTISEDPDEVFTLGPSAAQTMWEIGARDEVVGVSYSDISYVDYLPGVEDETNAGNPGFTPISTSVVINEDPDLVLAANVISEAKVEQLRDAGLTVYQFREAKSIDFVVEKTRDYGRFVGRCEDANDRADQMQAEVDVIRDAVDDVQHPKGLYLFGPTGYTAGEGTFINELVQAAGVDNIADERVSGYSQLSTEVILEEDPAWLVRTREFDTSAYAGTTFHDENQIITVNDNFMNQPGPRIVDVMRDIVKAAHPEAYERANLGEFDDDSGGTWTALQDDGTAVLSVEDAQRATTSFEMPDAFEPNGSAVHLETLDVTADGSGRTYLTTVKRTSVDAGDEMSGVPAANYTLEAGGLTDEEFVSATVEFTVPLEALDARNASGTDVQVWVATDLSWDSVETAVVDESEERVRLRATIPREAAFAVTMPPVVEEELRTDVTTETSSPTTAATTTASGGEETSTPDGETESPSESTTAAAGTATADATAGRGPGFGLVVPLGALLVVALLARRR
jgi:iron complex transport system substrate-binding protein